jgi:hypothetical protein
LAKKRREDRSGIRTQGDRPAFAPCIAEGNFQTLVRSIEFGARQDFGVELFGHFYFPAAHER